MRVHLSARLKILTALITTRYNPLGFDPLNSPPRASASFAAFWALLTPWRCFSLDKTPETTDAREGRGRGGTDCVGILHTPGCDPATHATAGEGHTHWHRVWIG